MTNLVKKAIVGLLFVWCLGLLIGCGYSSRSILKQNVGSVYVPIFDNKTFRRGLEFGLTKAIKDEIMFKTSLRVVDRGEADSVLTGEIVNFNENVLIVDADDNIMESRIFIAVDFKWTDLRTGRIISEGKEVVAPTEFIVNRGETIETAQNESFVDIAERIVDMLQERW